LFFEALAREKHFKRAAESVNVTQPALSAQIMDMEGKLGTDLVERNRGGISLTPTGKRLLPKARAILQQLEALEELATSQTETLTGTLEIGMIPTIAPYLLPKLLPALRSAFPALELKVQEAKTERLVQELTNGNLAAIIAAKPIDMRNIRSIDLFDDPFFMAAGRNSADVLSSPVAPDRLVMERLLLLEDGHCLRDQALTVCEAAGPYQLVNLGATSMTTLLQLVANGLGVTLIPAIAIEAETRKLDAIDIAPFTAPAPSRSIALFYRTASARTTNFEALGEIVQAAAAPLLAGASGFLRA
ncbi:MAG: LysR substrate-binding domain-containing protein, partial [Pseudomonadota bacterium]